MNITEQPKNVRAAVGDSVTLTVEAENVKSYQWQYSTNGGTSWLNSGSKTKNITFTVTAGNKGFIRRCVLTGTAGDEAITNEVGILDDSVKIITQPAEVSGNREYS